TMIDLSGDSQPPTMLGKDPIGNSADGSFPRPGGMWGHGEHSRVGTSFLLAHTGLTTRPEHVDRKRLNRRTAYRACGVLTAGGRLAYLRLTGEGEALARVLAGRTAQRAEQQAVAGTTLPDGRGETSTGDASPETGDSHG